MDGGQDAVKVHRHLLEQGVAEILGRKEIGTIRDVVAIRQFQPQLQHKVTQTQIHLLRSGFDLEFEGVDLSCHQGRYLDDVTGGYRFIDWWDGEELKLGIDVRRKSNPFGWLFPLRIGQVKTFSFSRGHASHTTFVRPFRRVGATDGISARRSLLYVKRLCK